MELETIIKIIGLLGIGAAIPKAIEYISDKQKNKDQTKHEYKQIRYKAIIVLMYAALDFDKNKQTLLEHRNFTQVGQLINELEAEWATMTLYASDQVIIAMKSLSKNKL